MKDHKETDAYQITWLIRRLFRAMAAKAGDYLTDLGVTAAERAVMEFLYPDARLTVPDLARRYKVSRQHIQVTVNRLRERRLITTEHNPRHSRSSFVRLTKQGQHLFVKISARDKKAIEELFAEIPAAEQERTRKTLERVLKQ